MYKDWKQIKARLIGIELEEMINIYIYLIECYLRKIDWVIDWYMDSNIEIDEKIDRLDNR